MFIQFFCLCPLSLTIKLNFNISKVAHCLFGRIASGARKFGKKCLGMLVVFLTCQLKCNEGLKNIMKVKINQNKTKILEI